MSDDLTTIPPALTEFEWLTWRQDGFINRQHLTLHTKGKGFLGYQRVDVIRSAHPSDDDCHAIAAAHLWGQPFGFTHREAMDVAWLAQHAMRWFNLGPVEWAAAQRAQKVAEKMAALLPPEEPT